MEALKVLMGFLAGGITMGVAAVFPEELSFAFFAVVLGLAAGVYPGFAMANSEAGRPLIQDAEMTPCLFSRRGQESLFSVSRAAAGCAEAPDCARAR